MNHSTPRKFMSCSSTLEQRSEWCTKIQLGLMGLAIMLMLMDMSKLYVLIPCAILMALIYQWQRIADNFIEEFKGASVEFSPRSLLISKPSSAAEYRIRFKDIKHTTRKRCWGIDIIELEATQQTKYTLFGFDKVMLDTLKQMKTTHNH